MNDARRRPRRTAAVALATVALLALAGCNDDKEPQQGSRPVRESPGATGGGSTAPGGDAASGSATASGSGSASASAATAPRIEVLGTGTGPRRLLRLELAQGHRETSTVEMVMRMEMGPVGKVEVPFVTPVTTTVTRADDDGYAFAAVLGRPTVDAARLPQALAATIEQTLGQVEGTTMRLDSGRDGAVTSSTIELPDGAPAVVARMTDTFASQAIGMTVPLPAEAVGVGARWRAVSTLRLSGTTSTITTTYELTQLRDDGYTLKLSVQQRTHPGTAAGGGSIVKGSATGTGTLTGRSGFVMPVSSESSLEGSSVVEVGGQRVGTGFGVTMRQTTR